MIFVGGPWRVSCGPHIFALPTDVYGSVLADNNGGRIYAAGTDNTRVVMAEDRFGSRAKSLDRSAFLIDKNSMALMR